VVWFGESIPSRPLAQAIAAAEDCDLFMSIGTSSLVYPAAGLATRAQRSGATLVEINPEPTELARQADFVLTGPAGKILPALWQALADRRQRGR
jgi:NAD-dependent deacetylase